MPSPPLLPSLSSHLNRGRLEQLVAEHLDHLHYISDIISLGMDALNEIIADHFLNRLLIPLYVYSLTDMSPNAEGVRGSMTQYLLVYLSILILAQKSNRVYFCFTGGESSYQ